MEQGKAPRMFGRSGQAQLGVDLVVSNGRLCDVYQCKNLALFTIAGLESWLEMFASQWLAKVPDLPIPRSFVVVCPAIVNDRKIDGVIQRFTTEYDVEVYFWHRTMLDQWLRGLPDIVTDVFSPEIARAFCTVEGFSTDLYRPLKKNSGESRTIERFMSLDERGHIARDPAVVAQFASALAEHKCVLLTGRSGSGKTTTALDLAKLTHSRGWRIFYTSLKYQDSEASFVRGIEMRSGRPTVFVIDDCDKNYLTAANIVDRVRPLLTGKDIRLVMIAREGRQDSHVPRDLHSFFAHFLERDNVIELVTDSSQFLRIAELKNPAVMEMSGEQFNALVAMSCHDLVIFDELLQLVSTTSPETPISYDALYRSILKRYFNSVAVHAPRLKYLAALGQFDIPIALADIAVDNLSEEADAIRQLIYCFGPPARCSFVHSSTAEVIFRALLWAEGTEDWLTSAAEPIIDTLILRTSGPVSSWLYIISGMLSCDLSLANGQEVKKIVFTDERIVGRLSMLHAACDSGLLREIAELFRGVKPSLPLGAWLYDRVQASFTETPEESVDFAGLEEAFRALSFTSQELTSRVENELGAEKFRDALSDSGSLLNLLRILESCTYPFALSIVDGLTCMDCESMVERALHTGAPISYIIARLHRIKYRDPKRALIKLIEHKCGVHSLYRLVMQHGSLSDLLKVLDATTSEFAIALIGQMKASDISVMVERLATHEGSFKTLGMLLYALKKQASHELVLIALLEKIEADTLSRAIIAQADLVDFLRILRNCSIDYRRELLSCVDSAGASALIKKAVQNGRSVGALHFSIDALREGDNGATSLRQLEAFISPESMSELICTRGTLVEFLELTKCFSTPFVKGMIDSLNADAVDTLILHTIRARTSLGTINLALGALAGRGSNGSLRSSLEAKVRPTKWWQLISRNADLNTLSYMWTGFSQDLRKELLVESMVQADGWHRISLRSNFYAVCKFGRDVYPQLPPEIKGRVLATIKIEAHGMTERTTWSELRSGLAALEKVTDPLFVEIMQPAATARIMSVSDSDLVFADIIEAANAFHCIYRADQSKWQLLAGALRKHLPEKSTWPRDYTALQLVRSLLAIIRYPGVTRQDAIQITQECAEVLKGPVPQHTEPKLAFLALWNVYSSYIDLELLPSNKFQSVWEPVFVDSVVKALKLRNLSRRGREEILSSLSLVGLIVWLQPSYVAEMREIVVKTAINIKWFVESAMTMTFIPAFFALVGISLDSSIKYCFSSQRRAALSNLSFNYESAGKAIISLREWLQEESVNIGTPQTRE
jgi:energy-coupling factor transporter ATP-binding protein EcfA2